MNKHMRILIDTIIASILCSIFQSTLTAVLYARNLGLDSFPSQLIIVGFAMTFIATFIPLLGFNLFKQKYQK